MKVRRLILALVLAALGGRAGPRPAGSGGDELFAGLLYGGECGGNLADVENLLPPGTEPHEFQFSPREVKRLEARTW